MPRRLIENSAFDPDTVKMMGEVFDEIWARVEPDFRHLNTRQVEAVRVALASAVLAYAGLGIRDPLVLRGMALGFMKRPAHV